MANPSNFTRGFTPASNPERGNKSHGKRNWLLFMLKGPRLKTASCRTFVFPEYGMTNASNFSRGFTPSRNPENDKKHTGNWRLFMLKWPRLKQCHIVSKAGHRSTLAFLRFCVIAATGIRKHTQVDVLWITRRIRRISAFPSNSER